MDQPPVEATPTPPQHRWQALSAIDRRVLGVLGEKAKTTPDVYPMSLNGITAGCNQKSNRWPLMQLESDGVEESLDRLRGLGAVGLVEGYGRVQKYRHYLYDWLGVDKVEIAVMIELLLRGDQTVGDLRGRASRMEPIADLAALRLVVDSLKSKGLVISLTPEGRGHVVTHALYKPREIESLQTKYSSQSEAQPSAAAEHSPAPSAAPRETPASDALRRELASLGQQVAQFQRDLDELREAQLRTSEELRALRDSLGG